MVPVLAAWGLAALLTACSAASQAASAPSPSPTPTRVQAEAMATDDGGDEVPTVLPATDDAGRAYVDETLFLGDSNTARYMMYADETGAPYTSLRNNIGVVSMGVQAISSLRCEGFQGRSGLYTMPEAVAMLKPRRIVIGFGTNDLSGSSTDASAFIKTYREGLQAICEAWPYADIIVSAIPPLDRQRDNTNLTMVQVDAYNEALVEMCRQEGFHFLDTAEVLRDSATGWAKADYTLSDGVHLSRTAVSAFFAYLRTHAFLAEDRRPQPLGDIPIPSGTPPRLIEHDPIAVRGAKVPVEFVAANGGTLQGPTSQKVRKGSACASVTAVASKGWAFDHWAASMGSVGSSATLTFTVPADATANGVVVTAYFTPAEHEHAYEEREDERIEPTCTEPGAARYVCRICGERTEEELPALGHDWGKAAVIPATDKSLEPWWGVYARICRRCGKVDPVTPTPSPEPATPTPAPATPTPAPATPTPTPATPEQSS